jgi:hypothetical protein
MNQNREVPVAAGRRALPGIAALAAALLVTAAAFASFGTASPLFAEAVSAPALHDSYTGSFLMSDAPASPAAPVAEGKTGDAEAATALRNWTYTDRVPSRFN